MSEILEETKRKLQVFLERHPRSSIISDEADRCVLSKPWGDESVEIALNEDDDQIITHLNEIQLPERYSAIYHHNLKSLEVAYTVFMPSAGADIRTREFQFHHDGVTYPCKFSASSNTLLHLARHARQKESYGSSNHRNLMSYNTYMLISEKEIDYPEEMAVSYKDAQPISFWIEGLDWDDDRVLDLVHHLNFYMTYYDGSSPTILIHTPADESREFNGVNRFPFGKFPEHIKSNNIDRNLLHFWQASRNGDPARRFLYNYQVLEYASYYMIEDEISKSITKLLLSPDSLSRAAALASQIHETIGSSRMQDSQKVEMLLRKFVAPEVVWMGIEANKDFFCEPTEFEGGFRVNALVQKKWDASDFKTNWPGTFAASLRNMRNALSHGKEVRMSSVITPTAKNLRLLQPWVQLIAAAVREIMVYRNIQ